MNPGHYQPIPPCDEKIKAISHPCEFLKNFVFPLQIGFQNEKIINFFLQGVSLNKKIRKRILQDSMIPKDILGTHGDTDLAPFFFIKSSANAQMEAFQQQCFWPILTTHFTSLALHNVPRESEKWSSIFLTQTCKLESQVQYNSFRWFNSFLFLIMLSSRSEGDFWWLSEIYSIFQKYSTALRNLKF